VDRTRNTSPSIAFGRRATRRCAVALAVASLVACFGTSGSAAPDDGIHGAVTIPLTKIVFSGNRYVAEADLGLGKPVPLMIHGNAGMFLMVTHEIGEQVTGGPVPKLEDYGYSAKGKGRIRVPRLRFGERRLSDLRDVPVFDYLADGGGPAQGMIGVPFLTGERAAIDFSRDVMVLGVKRSSSPDRKILKSGYHFVAFKLDAKGKATIPVFFPALGRTLSITPSTVSNALTLHRPPFAGAVPMTRDTKDSDHSPSGTHPELFHADLVAFEIAGVKLGSPASFEDFAEYANTPESELSSFGLLGFDWMKEHAAIIDYANRFLYFRP